MRPAYAWRFKLIPQILFDKMLWTKTWLDNKGKFKTRVIILENCTLPQWDLSVHVWGIKLISQTLLELCSGQKISMKTTKGKKHEVIQLSLLCTTLVIKEIWILLSQCHLYFLKQYNLQTKKTMSNLYADTITFVLMYSNSVSPCWCTNLSIFCQSYKKRIKI